MRSTRKSKRLQHQRPGGGPAAGTAPHAESRRHSARRKNTAPPPAAGHRPPVPAHGPGRPGSGPGFVHRTGSVRAAGKRQDARRWPPPFVRCPSTAHPAPGSAPASCGNPQMHLATTPGIRHVGPTALPAHGDRRAEGIGRAHEQPDRCRGKGTDAPVIGVAEAIPEHRFPGHAVLGAPEIAAADFVDHRVAAPAMHQLLHILRPDLGRQVRNDVGPVFDGDPIFPKYKVEYYGQPLFAVAATSTELARKAVLKAKIIYKKLKPIVTIKEALKKKNIKF